MKKNELINRISKKLAVHHGWTFHYTVMRKQLTPFQCPPAPDLYCLPLLPPGSDGISQKNHRDELKFQHHLFFLKSDEIAAPCL